MKYEIEKLGESGKIYIEEEDLVDIKPAKDGTHAVELAVRYRRQYQSEPAFEWQGSKDEALRLRLLPRQAMEIVEQERKTQTGFCADCYDFGKSESAPKECVRCQLLQACRKSGLGDYRKIRPATAASGPGYGYTCAMSLLIVLWWWTLCQWANSATQSRQLQVELSTVRRATYPEERTVGQSGSRSGTFRLDR